MTHEKIATEGLRAFFERFQSLSAASDVERLATMYAASVMIAGPRGSQVVSSADLQRAIPEARLVEDQGDGLVAAVESEVDGRLAEALVVALDRRSGGARSVAA